MGIVAVDQSETCGGEHPQDQNAIELTISRDPSHSGNEASNFDSEAQVAVERPNFAGRGVLLLSYSWGKLIETWHGSHPDDYEYYRWRTLASSNRRCCRDQHHHPHGYFIALNSGIARQRKERRQMSSLNVVLFLVRENVENA